MNPRCTHPKSQATLCKLCQVWTQVTSGMVVASEPSAPTRRQCIHLGTLVERVANCSGKCWHTCDAGFGVEGRARPGIECQTCTEYVKDDPDAEPEPKRPEAGPFDIVATGHSYSAESASHTNHQPLSGVGLNCCHHGVFGDIIYALPTVKAICEESGWKANVWLYPRVGTRVTMSAGHAANLIPLLRQQEYIAAVEFSPVPVGVRLDAARRFVFKDPGAGLNIAEQYRQWLALPPFDRTKSWLRVDEPNKVTPVVFARSARYRPKGFPWKRIAKRFQRNAVFIGTDKEHADFCKEAESDVHHHRTETLLDVARVIAGCELFIGNQSCPRAIAEGLKVPVVVEESDKVPDTKFLRKGAWYGRRDDFWCEALDR